MLSCSSAVLAITPFRVRTLPFPLPGCARSYPALVAHTSAETARTRPAAHIGFHGEEDVTARHEIRQGVARPGRVPSAIPSPDLGISACMPKPPVPRELDEFLSRANPAVIALQPDGRP